MNQVRFLYRLGGELGKYKWAQPNSGQTFNFYIGPDWVWGMGLDIPVHAVLLMVIRFCVVIEQLFHLWLFFK